MEENALRIMKNKLEEVGQKDFAVQVEMSYNKVKEKSIANRDKHFSLQKKILFCSAGVSIVNVLVTFLGTVQCILFLVPLATSVSSILSIIVTTLIAQKGAKKYSETWIRHQKHRSDMEFEIMEYVYNNGKYRGCGEQEKADKFKESMFDIWKKNQERFNINMEKFDIE